MKSTSTPFPSAWISSARISSVLRLIWFFLAVIVGVGNSVAANDSLSDASDTSESPPVGRPISFELDIQPVLTSLGCNAGACHGKQRGQNGFQLSLLGFDSQFDYNALTKQSRGRRIFPAAPENSLLLRKATAELPHGGGRLLEEGTANYETLLNWIRQGAPLRYDNEASFQGIALNARSMLLKTGEPYSLNVIAFYSDGTTRDVTQQTTFQSNDPAIVKIDASGKMVAGKLPGETAIMARYQNQIEVCHVAIPLAEPIVKSVYEKLPRNNFIDELVWEKLQRLNVVPSTGIDDSKFMRRVYTDIIGRLPTAAEAREYLLDKNKNKRFKLIDDLLDRPEYAEFAANKWVDLLRTNPYRVGIKTTLNYDHWIRQQFRDNVPYDQFVRELISARGSTFRHGAVTMFRDRRSPDELTTIVSQLFLGIRLECAKCHHHPFEKWSQEDFYSFAAYFANVSRKGTGLSPPISGSEEIVLETGKGKVSHPITGAVLSPRPLFQLAAAGETDEDRMGQTNGSVASVAVIDANSTETPLGLRDQLADWIANEKNEYFAQVQVNRVWADLMGRGIVEPVDDFRATNPASNQELLTALAKDFRDHGFDQKHLIRTICRSAVYSLSSEPNQKNVGDRLNYSRHYRHRLRAETLLDSVAEITGVPFHFEALPEGSKSVEIWTHRTRSLFLDTFGRPNPNEDPPCVRTSEFTVTQSLHLMNARDIHTRLGSESGRVMELAKSNKSYTELADEIYLMIFSRFPDANEREFAIETLSAGDSISTTIEKQGTGSKPVLDQKKIELRRRNLQDLMWAMINTAEFSIQD